MDLDFEVLYKSFPRKEGKAKGMTKLKKTVKDHETYVRFGNAVTNYIELCKLEKREKTYIKHWATFVNCWEDYESREDLGLPAGPYSGALQVTQFKPVMIRR